MRGDKSDPVYGGYTCINEVDCDPITSVARQSAIPVHGRPAPLPV